MRFSINFNGTPTTNQSWSHNEWKNQNEPPRFSLFLHFSAEIKRIMCNYCTIFDSIPFLIHLQHKTKNISFHSRYFIKLHSLHFDDFNVSIEGTTSQVHENRWPREKRFRRNYLLIVFVALRWVQLQCNVFPQMIQSYRLSAQQSIGYEEYQTVLYV